MIKPVTMYSVVCDRCGKPFIDEFNGIVAWLEKELQKSKQWKANGQRLAINTTAQNAMSLTKSWMSTFLKRKEEAMKELKDLVVGDEVLVIGMHRRRIAKVDKVTKTQIVVNNARFRRDSGWQCGSDRWNVRRISVPTEKEISDVKEENLRKKLVYAISSFDFERLSTDELKQVYNIVEGKEK